jgi:catechol 2,3-dioxygenase-like lactoylglutathione lyase family enzyme
VPSVSVRLNHTIVWCRDMSVSAGFLTDVLGLDPPTAFGPFLVAEAANEVELAFHETDAEIAAQHYAFLTEEKEFDEILGRVRERGLDYWADPGLRMKGETNPNDGGRGVYFKDPDGHLLEIITRPYGSGG